MGVKKIKDTAQADVRRIERELKKLPQDAYKFWVSITPKDTGNARRNTSLRNNTIESRYPYAQRLDEGWSKQYGGRGMSKPTEEYVKKRLKSILGK